MSPSTQDRDSGKMHTCVVVAAGEATRNFLEAALLTKGLDAVLLASLGELPHALETVPVCGVLVELASSVTATAQHKKAAQDVLEFYPSVKFRLVDERVLIVGETLDQFALRCIQFNPRPIRKSVRVEKYLAAYLSADESFTDAERVVTLNVSLGGFFVYSAREWTVGSRVWLRLHGEEDAVGGTVRSVRAWGNNVFIPGIGIESDVMKPVD